MGFDRHAAAAGRAELVGACKGQLPIVLFIVWAAGASQFVGRIGVWGEVVKVERVVLLRGEELRRYFLEALSVAARAVVMVE